jgi:hypothetical protein
MVTALTCMLFEPWFFNNSVRIINGPDLLLLVIDKNGFGSSFDAFPYAGSIRNSGVFLRAHRITNPAVYFGRLLGRGRGHSGRKILFPQPPV